MSNRLKSDVRFALRRARKAPGFSVVVILTLALGIGMTTAMFSVVDGLLLTRLPYPEAERLVMLWQGRRGQDVDEDWFSVAQFVDIRDGTDVFEELTLAVGFGATLTNRGAPSQVGDVRTTSTYLRLLGATPALGRLLDDADDLGGAPTVALLESLGVPSRTFDVLSDESIRSAAKGFAGWPTFPQLYVKGEFIGGNDILMDMYDAGELQELVAGIGA